MIRRVRSNDTDDRILFNFSPAIRAILFCNKHSLCVSRRVVECK